MAYLGKGDVGSSASRSSELREWKSMAAILDDRGFKAGPVGFKMEKEKGVRIGREEHKGGGVKEPWGTGDRLAMGESWIGLMRHGGAVVKHRDDVKSEPFY
jgi:hypothetical protein